MAQHKKLKIAMIGQKGIPAIYGGIERHVEEIAKRLVNHGHDVTVYCRPYYMGDNKYTSNLFENINLKILPTIKSKHLDAIVHTCICSLDSLFRSFDIVHYHAIGPSTLSFLPRLTGKKVVVTVHGLDWQRQKWSKSASLFLKCGEKTSYYFPHKTITVSQTLKKYYEHKYKGEVTYIPNGVNIPSLLPPDKIQFKYSLDKEGYIVFISRLVPEKGTHYLIDAYKQIKTDKKLVIVGGSSHSDEYVTALKEQAQGDNRILFTGNVHGPELAELFSNAYFFVLPSELEGLPIVVLEALSFRQCVLASDISENMEVIAPTTKDRYGFSFKSKNVADLTDKLQYLLDHPVEVHEMKQKTLDYVSREFNWDTITEQLETLYFSLKK